MGTESHLINIEILDNHEEATIGAFLICDLCAMVSSAPSVFRCMPGLVKTDQSVFSCGGVSIFCHKPQTNDTLRLIG